MNGPIHEVPCSRPHGSEARGIAFEQVALGNDKSHGPESTVCRSREHSSAYG
jgi:hypothetical protein